MIKTAFNKFKKLHVDFLQLFNSKIQLFIKDAKLKELFSYSRQLTNFS